MGDSPGIHPYLHAESEASASVDMMKAMMELCASPLVNVKPDGNLYLSGYSQGALAALATQRELQAYPLPGLSLRKTIAGSGAYNLSSIQKKFVINHPEYPNPSFMPYLLFGYQNVYGNLYTDLSQVSEYLSDISSSERILSIYPNPATDIVFVEIPDDVSDNSRMCIYDIMGKLLLSQNIDRNLMEININAFPRGLYKVVITGLNIYAVTLVITR